MLADGLNGLAILHMNAGRYDQAESLPAEPEDPGNPPRARSPRRGAVRPPEPGSDSCRDPALGGGRGRDRASGGLSAGMPPGRCPP